MRIDAVVVNASPLISMFRSGQSDLLPRLFSRIVARRHSLPMDGFRQAW